MHIYFPKDFRLFIIYVFIVKLVSQVKVFSKCYESYYHIVIEL